MFICASLSLVLRNSAKSTFQRRLGSCEGLRNTNHLWLSFSGLCIKMSVVFKLGDNGCLKESKGVLMVCKS